MLGEHYGDDHEYADSRVRGTVVMHDGEPVHVDNVFRHDETGVPTAVIRHIVTGKSSAVDLKSLDLEPFNLGYVNYANSASYICRAPMRRDYKQGMRHQNIKSQYGYRSCDIPFAGFYDTIMNKFPPYGVCLNLVGKKGIESWAWHLNWAVDNKGNLLHKFGEIVGTVQHNTTPVLFDTYKHLQESLEETL